jgi:protein transport protein SEC24
VDYFCTLDANGTRRDIADRPELRHGTVEFIASQEYMVRPPMPPTFFFAFDVSANAVSSGFLAKAVNTVKGALDELPGGERTHVGFLTYDNTIHFYGLKPGSETPQMMVVAELDEPFCPAPDDLLVNLGDSRDSVDALLDMLPNAFVGTSQVDSCMGPAVQAAYMAMNHIGGKLMMFQCTLPSLGQGRLLNRGDDHRNAGTDKEHLVRAPADPFFKKMAAECSRQQICVDIFASASPYGDLASLSILPRYTGGQLYHYPGFRAERDGLKLRNELRHNLTRFTAWEAVCRVRCSKGFRVSSFNGHFFVRSMDLLALPATNADAAYAVQIAHDEQLPTSNVSYLQCALLYTTADGERRIRVHTMSVPVVPDIAQMFRSIDGGAMSAFLTRLAVERSLTARLQDAREAMQLKLSQSMREFRLLNTSAARAFNCLIFPDMMRLMPLFTLCAAKSPSLRGQTRDVSVDERIRSTFEILSAPTEAILRRLYPAMYALHAMPPEAGLQNEAGGIVMPPRTVLAGERVDARGAYLVDDGRQCLIWLGKMLDRGFINAVFGAQGPPNPDVDFEPTLVEETQLSKQVCGVIAEVRRRAANGCHCTLTVIKQGEPSEALLFPLLVEDRGAGGAGAMSYADFLILLHRQVAQTGGLR